MCLSKAWFSGESTAKPIMEDIAKITVQNQKVILRSLFGDEKTLDANIEEVDFTRNIVMLAKHGELIS